MQSSWERLLEVLEINRTGLRLKSFDHFQFAALFNQMSRQYRPTETTCYGVHYRIYLVQVFPTETLGEPIFLLFKKLDGRLIIDIMVK
jgi:hypothetical protein